MAKYILERAGDIDWMALFALLTFFIIFSVSVIVLFMGNRRRFDHMARLPLDDYAPSTNPETIES